MTTFEVVCIVIILLVFSQDLGFKFLSNKKCIFASCFVCYS